MFLAMPKGSKKSQVAKKKFSSHVPEAQLEKTTSPQPQTPPPQTAQDTEETPRSSLDLIHVKIPEPDLSSQDGN